MRGERSTRPVIEFDGQTLNWIQPKLMQRYHELAGGGKIFATLKWQKIFGSLAVGTTSENSYSFKRAGFLHPHIIIRRLDFEDDIATMRMGFSGNGTLEFTNGSSYSFRRLGFWRQYWQFIDPNGKLVCTLHRKATIGRYRGEAVIEKDAKKLKEIALLATLGWYVVVLLAEEAAAAGVATGASSH